MPIDSFRHGAGKCRDLYVGTGKTFEELDAAKNTIEVQARNLAELTAKVDQLMRTKSDE